MGIARLLLTAAAAFVVGVIGMVSALVVMSATGLLAQGIFSVPVTLMAFFGPGIGAAILVGRRLSPAKAADEPAPPRTEAEDESDDDDVAALRAELSRTPAAGRTGQVAAVLLVIFVLQGLREGSVRSLLILVGVLLFHEGGHALGMLAFGYRDVRVFFLPFFGAAATGRKANAPAWQRAVVLLLGPLPGVMLGIALLAVSGRQGILGEIGRMAVYINVFNMLPFEPLDGGRVLGVTLFSRSRWLEAAFGVLGAVAIFAMGLQIEAWALAVFAVFALIGVMRRVRFAGAAGRVTARGVDLRPSVEALSPAALAALDVEARALNPTAARALPARAALVRELHDCTRVSPPDGLATLGILGAYGGGWVMSFMALALTAR